MTEAELVGYRSAMSEVIGIVDNLLRGDLLKPMTSTLAFQVLKATLVQHTQDLTE